MTQERRITDKLPDQPLQWDENASPAAAPAAGQAGLEKTPSRAVMVGAHAAFSEALPPMSLTSLGHANVYRALEAAVGEAIRLSAAFDRLAAPVAADTEQATDEILAAAQARMWEALDRRACPGPWMQIASDAIFNFKKDSYGAPLATPADAPTQQPKMPEGWEALSIVYNEDMEHPEEVAYGPPIMMRRLGKWLDKFMAQEIASRATPADAGAGKQTAQQQKECAPPFAAPASQRKAIIAAAVNCGHSIDENKVVLHRDKRKEGNALSQLADRLEAEWARRCYSEDMNKRTEK